jgi:hypothetical protein
VVEPLLSKVKLRIGPEGGVMVAIRLLVVL